MTLESSIRRCTPIMSLQALDLTLFQRSLPITEAFSNIRLPSRNIVIHRYLCLVLHLLYTKHHVFTEGIASLSRAYPGCSHVRQHCSTTHSRLRHVLTPSMLQSLLLGSIVLRDHSFRSQVPSSALAVYVRKEVPERLPFQYCLQ